MQTLKLLVTLEKHVIFLYKKTIFLAKNNELLCRSPYQTSIKRRIYGNIQFSYWS